MWRDLIAQVDSGLGHETDKNPQPGALAIFCPACPQPGINLPQGWESDPRRYQIFILLIIVMLIMSRWLYTRSIVIDGNFAAENLKMKQPEGDVALSPGGRYMVEPQRYKLHLMTGKEVRQVGLHKVWMMLQLKHYILQKSLCSDHKAVNYVNNSQAHLRSTGIGAVACARHGCFFPDSVVDFQKGER